jgi:hypothetical protein
MIRGRRSERRWARWCGRSCWPPQVESHEIWFNLVGSMTGLEFQVSPVEKVRCGEAGAGRTVADILGGDIRLGDRGFVGTSTVVLL